MALVKKERSDLLSLFGDRLNKSSLDHAIRRRPLAVALSGGGGTSFIFIGAFYALSESGIKPQIISGSSMGAIIGAYRARKKEFSFDGIDALIAKTSWGKIAQPFSGQSRFGIPGTFRLFLRDVIGHEFEQEGYFLQLKDLEIPFRVCVAGLSYGHKSNKDDLEEYAHLLEERQKKNQGKKLSEPSMIAQILEFAQKPLKAIYLGGDQLTSEFDVLDAVGFSSAVPGVFHYDILRNDPRMIELLTKLLEREKVLRLLDGGFVDNLPASELVRAVDNGDCEEGFDPFVLSLDGFSPKLNRHLLFYPLMRFALENSRQGHEASHLSIRYQNVLSPVHFIPSHESFQFAVKKGYQETSAHVQFIRKMVGPIPDPTWSK